jgi:hypothetical protein
MPFKEGVAGFLGLRLTERVRTHLRPGTGGSWVFSRFRHGSLSSRMKLRTSCGLTLYTHQIALASTVDSTKNQQVTRVLFKTCLYGGDSGLAVGHGPARPGGMGRVSRLAAGVGLSGGDPHPRLRAVWRPFGRYIARPVSGRQGRPLRRRTICTPDVYLFEGKLGVPGQRAVPHVPEILPGD